MSFVIPVVVCAGLVLTLMGVIMLFNPKQRTKSIFNDIYMKMFLAVGIPTFLSSVSVLAFTGFKGGRDITDNFFLFSFGVLFSVGIGQLILSIYEFLTNSPGNLKKASGSYFAWESREKLKMFTAYSAAILELAACMSIFIFGFVFRVN